MERRIGIVVGVAAINALVLRAMGRVWWCACGSWVPWSFDVWSAHNSQHLVDPYTFSHVQHGFVFGLVLWLVLRARRPDLQLALVAVAEAAWEIVENTDAVIDRYRETTVSLDYTGDSIPNSTGDLLACLLGFVLARRLPWWQTLILYVAFELGMILTIRDSLLLNVWMLLAPSEAVRAWQGG